MFSIVLEGLSRVFLHARSLGSFGGIRMVGTLHVFHPLFVDGILLFSMGLERKPKS